MNSVGNQRLAETLDGLGRLAILSREALLSIIRWRIDWGDLLYQIYFIGVKSQPVVLITGAFTGMVLGTQTYIQFHAVKMDTATLAVVGVAMCTELGPVLTGLMVAGRVGAAIAAELGTMRVTEQIDALRTLATHPVDYLVVPRLLALHIAMPLLTAEAIALGIGAGYLVGVHLLGIDATYSWSHMLQYTDREDLAMGLIKSFIFGGVIALIGCYKGMNCGEGAEGVGRATTEAVVYSSITILISNFFLTLTLIKLLGHRMIEVRELVRSFGTNRVLEGVSFRIEKGESVVIIGRSGCGKSVLLKHIISLSQPDAGEVWIAGEKITGLDERELIRVRRRFGMLFQGAALFDSMTVAENVAFAFRHERKLAAAKIARRVAEVLEVVDLPGIENKKPAELSGGMRKRVGLARAIIYRPEIVLYDEPTTGLDPIVSDSIDKLLIRVREKLQVTTVVVTHDMRSARRVGQRILMLHDRKIYTSGTPDEIFRSTDPVVKQFIDGVSDPKEVYF